MHVQITMGTRNGARYLPEQLASFRQQTHTDWSLWVSDDGSTDETTQIIQDFSAQVPQDVHLVKGPENGAASNFLSLLCHPKLRSLPVALADQDDVWLPEKLTRALAVIAEQTALGPVMTCARTQVVDARLRPLHLSSARPRPPSFPNALVQTIAGGNTFMLNTAALKLVRAAGPDVDVPFHDWWLYILITGAGGTVFYDEQPCLLYRQHGQNVRGRNRGIAARFDRLHEILDSRFKQCVEQNLTALNDCAPLLTTKAREAHSAFTECRQLRGAAAVRLARRLGIHRQNRAETLVILCALAAGRI